jgi:hypothetical protein
VSDIIFKDRIMVAAGCELQSRFTGYESEAFSPDFRMEAVGGRFECRERRVGRPRVRGGRRGC